MLLGILSDSHGDAKMTAKAVALLLARGAKKLVHCGDLCGDGVLDELAGHDCVFVWGNCDRPSGAAARYVKALGLPWPEVPVRLEIAGRRIGVFHGHELEFESAVEDGAFDYILHGHTHQLADHRVGDCRVINPGALHRAAIKTVCLLNVKSDEATFMDVGSGREVRVAAR